MRDFAAWIHADRDRDGEWYIDHDERVRHQHREAERAARPQVRPRWMDHQINPGQVIMQQPAPILLEDAHEQERDEDF